MRTGGGRRKAGPLHPVPSWGAGRQQEGWEAQGSAAGEADCRVGPLQGHTGSRQEDEC